VVDRAIPPNFLRDEREEEDGEQNREARGFEERVGELKRAFLAREDVHGEDVVGYIASDAIPRSTSRRRISRAPSMREKGWSRRRERSQHVLLQGGRLARHKTK